MSSIKVASVTSTIHAPIEHVWAIVSAFSAIKAWMPSIDSCSATGNSLGSVRTINWAGSIVVETLDLLDEANHEISYYLKESSSLPLRNPRGRITLMKKDDKTTQITWNTEATSFAPEVDDSGRNALAGMFEKFIATSIESLKASLEPAKVRLS